jgi:hypothetical protein
MARSKAATVSDDLQPERYPQLGRQNSRTRPHTLGPYAAREQQRRRKAQRPRFSALVLGDHERGAFHLRRAALVQAPLVEVVALDDVSAGLRLDRLDAPRLHVHHILLVLGDPLDEQHR